MFFEFVHSGQLGNEQESLEEESLEEDVVNDELCPRETMMACILGEAMAGSLAEGRITLLSRPILFAAIPIPFGVS